MTDRPMQYTCGSKFGTFRIVPVVKAGSLVWATYLNDEEIAVYFELHEAFDALINADEPWPSCGDFAEADLPEDPSQWFRKPVPIW